jgi:phospholipid transport system substrate-binding protein
VIVYNYKQFFGGIDMKYRKVVFVMFVSIFVITVAQSYLWSAEPEELVKEVILNESSPNETKNIQEHKTKLWDEISPSFNFEEISKRVMGKYWKKLLHEEKSEFVELFTNYLKSSYIRRTNPLFGKEIISLRKKQFNKYARVQAELLTKAEKEISTDFYLLNENGEWKIYDLVIEGVSLVNNYYRQINSTLIRTSYEELVQTIKQKQGKGDYVPEYNLLASGWTKRTH